MALEMATFAAGCFWGVEASFRDVPGVVSAEVGYTGGHYPNPAYEEVCAGTTGHAEAVRVTFDPQPVSYDELLDHFWEIHDPTQLNRQGPDRGSQYRSAIFFEGPGQRATAEASQQRAQAEFGKPILTEIVPASDFCRAEEYHQRYYEKAGRLSCPL